MTRPISKNEILILKFTSDPGAYHISYLDEEDTGGGVYAKNLTTLIRLLKEYLK